MISDMFAHRASDLLHQTARLLADIAGQEEVDAVAWSSAGRSAGLPVTGLDGTSGATMWTPMSLHAEGFPAGLAGLEPATVAPATATAAYDASLARQIHIEGPTWPTRLWA